MKPIQFSFFIAIIAVFLFAGCAKQDKQSANDDEKAIAHVSGSAIMEKDFSSYLDERPIAGAEATYEEAVEARLEEMIIAEVMYREALRLEIDSDPEIRQALRQLLAQKLLDEQVHRPVWEREITENELQEYYNDHINEFVQSEQMRLADIFIEVPASSTPEMRDERRKRAEEALAGVLTGKGRFVFGEAIGKYSDQPANYSRGDTGLFDREGAPVGLDKEMVEAAFQLSRNGEIHDKVIETAGGFHIVMLVGKRSAVQKDLNDVAQQLEQRIRREELESKRKEYIQSLRGQADVRVEDQALEEIIARVKKSAESRGSDRPGQRVMPPAVPGQR